MMSRTNVAEKITRMLLMSCRTYFQRELKGVSFPEDTDVGLHLTKEALSAGLNLSSLKDALLMEDRNQVFMIAGGLLDMEIKRDS